MDLIICPRCGVVYDKDKREEKTEGWRYDTYSIDCPVCQHEIMSSQNEGYRAHMVDTMKMVINKNEMQVAVCMSCFNGEHMSYGNDHRKGEDGHRDCKNIGYIDGIRYQCCCGEGQGEDYWEYKKGDKS